MGTAQTKEHPSNDSATTVLDHHSIQPQQQHLHGSKHANRKEAIESTLNHMWNFYMRLLMKQGSAPQRRLPDPNRVEYVSFTSFHLDVNSFINIMQYFSVEDICVNIYPVCKEWYRVCHDQTYDEKLWKTIAVHQEVHQAHMYNFSGTLFSCDEYTRYLNGDAEEETPNPVYVKTGYLWRRYCILVRLYNKICEESFKHCFTGSQDLFEDIDVIEELSGKAVYFGPRNIPIGKTTLLHTMIHGKPLDENARNLPPTTGLEQTILTALVDQTSLVHTQNWDTVMSSFSTTVRSVQNCVVEAFLFDLGNESSFDTLTEGFTFDLINQPVGDARRLLIGVKDELKISNKISNRALEFARQHEMFYLECSSYTGHNVQLLARLVTMLGYFVSQSRKRNKRTDKTSAS
jgi:GTPase SAR1 family protein